MTKASVTYTEELAQSVYDLVTNRLNDHITPLFEFIQSLNLDRSIYCQLENEISGAICGAEHEAFVAGFTMSKALENVPLFAPSGD